MGVMGYLGWVLKQGADTFFGFEKEGDFFRFLKMGQILLYEKGAGTF